MRHLISFSIGLIGVIFGLVIWHAYNDHLLIHQIVTALSAASAQQAK